ncbi:DUF2029 domain-containing protein [Streptomyces sp. AJS327]|uniref:glycosyltransferase 87 family protein n=1 Tax=Streptomyces sp. AJS327 TaxID=2545265 RepID=UPI0015DD5E6A|nr:glycosyltransferase 87 family protein [Streptomyces sp. AJS327]MBA0050288.1 DUF2029 domain-containing protein [Streptomyces sp. AJS327]
MRLATAAWLLTRSVLLLCVLKVLTVPGPDVTSDVSVIYQGWYEVLRSGSFPRVDVSWQYPPAAALAILAPGPLVGLGPLDYTTAFYVLACVADLLVLVALLRAGARRGGGTGRGPGAGVRGGRTANGERTDGRWRGPGRRGVPGGGGSAGRAPGRHAGAWVWVLGVPLLGPTAYARYDLLVTAVAVAALLAAARRPRLSGGLAAFGALLKVWPALLLLGTPRGRDTRRGWTTALLTAAALTVALTVTLPGALGFLTAQRDRGTEVESLGAMVFHVARHLGWEGEVALHYGSVEFLGPHVATVSAAALGLSALGFGWLLLWRLRAVEWTPTTPAEAAFAAVLVFVTTSRVLSPQYLIWLVGLAAVCLALRSRAQLLPAVLVLLASGLTLLGFPVWFADVAASEGPGVVVLFLRNGLLVAATLICCTRLWRSTVTLPNRRRASTADRPPAARHADEHLLTW